MIEKTIIAYLNQHLSVPAYMERPEKNVPASYVLVEKTAGGEANHIASALIAVQSYAKSLVQAAELNEQVKTCMKSMVELGSVSRVHLNTDYNFTDPAKKRYRYQAVFDLVYFND